MRGDLEAFIEVEQAKASTYVITTIIYRNPSNSRVALISQLLKKTHQINGYFDVLILQIAVKRLKAMTAKAEMEFAVEVEILARVRHENLLGLRGFYAGGEERLIVYDYMPNHSLVSHLHGQLADQCLLDWQRRVNIAIGAAEGLL